MLPPHVMAIFASCAVYRIHSTYTPYWKSSPAVRSPESCWGTHFVEIGPGRWGLFPWIFSFTLFQFIWSRDFPAVSPPGANGNVAVKFASFVRADCDAMLYYLGTCTILVVGLSSFQIYRFGAQSIHAPVAPSRSATPPRDCLPTD